ncbi:MAG: YbbR-like domain-containing protein [Flavobacteriaceae bacterium]
MQVIKKKLSKLYKSKKVNVLIAFTLLALLFSLLSKLSKDYTKTISFKVEMLNVPQEHIILKDSLHKINVTLTTYGFNLLKYYFVNPKLQVDFNNLKKTSDYYLWTKNNEFQNISNQLNTSIKINGISPDSINFSYDSYFGKLVPVVLTKDITFASGFDIDGSYILEPDSVKVIGAKAVIDTILKIETIALKLDDVNSEINTSISLKEPKGNSEIKLSQNKIAVKGKVKKFTEGSFLVPVMVTNLPENVNIKYFPKEVEVIFYTSLDYYKTISANNFRVECDYSILNEVNNKLIPKVVKQPDSVKNVRLEVKSIEFIIQQ